MKVAAIIPAYNEERGIGDVLRAVTKSGLLSEVIVVSDGSTDRTVEIAKSFGVKVVEQSPNQGKAAAMVRGAKETDAEIITFIDADLVGLTPDLVDQIIKPVLDKRADTTMGIFQGGKLSTDIAQTLFPFLTGQRAIRHEIWDKMKIRPDSQYGVEMLWTKYILKHHLRVENVILKGCTQLFKEQKGQAVSGFGRRLKMVFDVAKAVFTPIEGKKPRRLHKARIIKKAHKKQALSLQKESAKSKKIKTSKKPVIRIINILECWDWNSPRNLAANIPVAQVI